MPAVVEFLVDSDKGMSEKALAVLDATLCTERASRSTRGKRARGREMSLISSAPHVAEGDTVVPHGVGT